MATGLVAGIAVGLLAGRITDRMSKKTVMIWSGLLRAVSVIFMLIAISTGSVWWMVVFFVLIQISAAFYFPALQVAIPLIAAENQLNGVHMNVSTLSRIIGTAAAGILLVLLPLSMLYIGSLSAYINLLILTLFLDFNEEKGPQQMMNKTQDNTSFKDVFPIIRGLPIVFMTLIMTLVPVLFLGGFNLMVINIVSCRKVQLLKAAIILQRVFPLLLVHFL